MVFTSDLHRAVQTADIAFGGTGVPIFRDWRLRECNYGAMNGVNVEELERTRRSHIDEPFEGGESYRHVVDRTRELLADLATDQRDRRVVIIGHSANQWALDHLVHGTPLEELVGSFEWQPGWRYLLLPTSERLVRAALSPSTAPNTTWASTMTPVSTFDRPCRAGFSPSAGNQPR